jgi:uncharacterized protein YidB (DUF937 family)
MGLFDQILGVVLSGAGGQAVPQPTQDAQPAPGAGTSAAGMLPQLLLAAIAHEGGVGGLMQKFQSAGLGGTIATWIGTGDNQSVSPASLQQVLSPETLQALAEKTGLPMGQLLAMASQHLPQMVDGLTPNGQVPGNTDALMRAGMSMLKSRFGIG